MEREMEKQKHEQQQHNRENTLALLNIEIIT